MHIQPFLFPNLRVLIQMSSVSYADDMEPDHPGGSCHPQRGLVSVSIHYTPGYRAWIHIIAAAFSSSSLSLNALFLSS